MKVKIVKEVTPVAMFLMCEYRKSFGLILHYCANVLILNDKIVPYEPELLQGIIINDTVSLQIHYTLHGLLQIHEYVHPNAENLFLNFASWTF